MTKSTSFKSYKLYTNRSEGNPYKRSTSFCFSGSPRTSKRGGFVTGVYVEEPTSFKIFGQFIRD